MRLTVSAWFLIIQMLAAVLALPALARESILVFAPASMTDVLQDVSKAYQARSDQSVVFSFAGTQQLARQLDAGAPADMYITADRDWMNWAVARDLVAAEKVFALAGNRLVIAVRNEVENWADINALLTSERFAMAEPDSVPAGRYARQALEKQGIWQQAQRQAIFGDNVRTTLRRLGRGEVTSAIVYGTDAAIEPRVRTLFVFPPDSHEPIVYWAAVTNNKADDKVLQFIEFLKSSDAGIVFAKAGFVPPASPSDLGEN